MKNKLSDLNDHLFAQIERLSEEDITEEEIKKEIKRTDAIVDVAKQIIDNARLSLDAARTVAECGGMVWGLAPMISKNENHSTELIKPADLAGSKDRDFYYNTKKIPNYSASRHD